MDQQNTLPNDTQIPTPPPTPTPLPVVPTTKPSPLVPISLGISIIALGAAGYFGYQNYQLTRSQLPAKTTQVAETTPPPTTDPTAGWKTYTDQKSGVSFKYPSSWTSSSDVGLFNDADKKWILGIETNNTPLSIQEWANKKCGSDIKGKLCSIESSKNLADALLINNYGSHYTELNTIAKHGDTIFEINISARNPNQSTDDVVSTYDQILSTFHFSEQSKTDKNTNTYTSREVGTYISPFSLTYSADWKINENFKAEEPKSLELTLTDKIGNSIKINQGAGGGGRCLYPDDSDYKTYEGAGRQFSSYIQLNQPAKWRISTGSDTTEVCQFADENYVDSTEIGWITLKYSDQAILTKMQTILESIQFKPTATTKTLFD